MLDLFADTPPWQEPLGPGAMILRRFAVLLAPALLQAIAAVASVSPFRQMVTPGGYTMSVAMTNCGQLGWTTDMHGYLYAPGDPLTGEHWPPMPLIFQQLAAEAAQEAVMRISPPDACLINRYQPGARSCRCIRIKTSGICARLSFRCRWDCRLFQFGGLKRNDPLRRLPLEHGDVVVWGGESRLFTTASSRLKPGEHPPTGACRYNLTFRLAGHRQNKK